MAHTMKDYMNKNLHMLGKVSRITFGSVPRPVFESYRREGFYTLGKAAKNTFGPHGVKSEIFKPVRIN